jgi:hypothetical protein
MTHGLKMTRRLQQSIIAFTVLFLTATPCPAPAGYLYNKNYIVAHGQGQDILCDPYVVQKNDWVIKLFARRGQIAEQDFPEFLTIFKRLNPHVADVDKILPGQHILIPLKKLENESLPGQSSGIVTIPFVAISRLPDFIKKDAIPYTVKPGDNVSAIIAAGYGKFGTAPYNKGVELFKLINPEITDLNRIYPGQDIHIPDPGLQDKAWYADLFDASGQINTDIDVKALLTPKGLPKADAPDNKSVSAPSPDTAVAQLEQPEEKPPVMRPTAPIPHDPNRSSLKKAAAALNAKFLDKGTYYFPGQGKQDFKIDLSRYPVMQLNDGTRILFCEKDDFSVSDKNVMMSFWKNLKILPLPFQSTFEQIISTIFASDDKYDLKNHLRFDDHGAVVDIKARWVIRSSPSASGQNKAVTCIFLRDNADLPVPDSLTRYLQDCGVMIREIDKEGDGISAPDPNTLSAVQESQNAVISLQNSLNGIVDDLITAVDCHYSEKINISFPYAGIQVNALSNLISTPKGRQLLVDYGDLYGDALTAIRKTGLYIVQLGGIKDWQTALKSIFNALNFSFTEHLDFKPVVRSGNEYIDIHIPGLVVDAEAQEKFLITQALFRSSFAQFLAQSGYHVIFVSNGGTASGSEDHASSPSGGPATD